MTNPAIFIKSRFKKKNSCWYARGSLLLFIAIFIFLPSGNSQVTPFQKSVLDSLEANTFNMSIAFAFNASQDGSSSLTTGTDIGMLYATKRSNYEIIQSSYYNRLESFSSSDRFIALARAALFSHELRGEHVVEKRVYPEPFFLYSYDAGRALNARYQFGLNGVYAFKPTRIIRIRAGMGLFYEKENWQMIKQENVPYIDTFSTRVKSYIFDTVGITRDGQLRRDNIRANFYSNFNCTFTKNISMNAFVCVQMPFVPPYKNIPQLDVLPVVTKLYPRITFDMQLSIYVLKKLNFITTLHLMYDKGQIPIYVPNSLYNLTEGLQISF